MKHLFHSVEVLTIFLILTLGLFSFNLALAQGVTVVSVSGPDKVRPEEQFTIDILVEPEAAIAGVQFNLTFDPSLVTVDSVAE
ncbi:cohesin domain-containing protein, partial [Chloroflexota bacterium]